MTWYTAEHPSNQFVEEKKSIIMSRKQRVSKMAVNVKTKVLMHISIYNLGEKVEIIFPYKNINSQMLVTPITSLAALELAMS